MFQKEGYPLDWLQELKDKNNIVEIISRYVPLKQSGGNFWGCCPFHHEKTPSFSVKEDEKFYHCFGCGASGDVISFIQQIEGLTFPEAVEMLAERAGMEVPTKSSVNNNYQEIRKQRDRLYEICTLTAKFYYNCLISDEGTDAREYLKSRGITDNLIVRFGLGFSPDFNAVITMLKEKGYSEKEIVSSGVGWQKKDGSGHPFDALQGRLIVPIFDARGRVVAFSGRAIAKEYTMGKYVHFHNTAIFDKSKIIYGANFVKKDKIKAAVDKVIIVEGYMDVISLYKYGFSNVVAGMGTAFTPGQARVLNNLSKNVYVCYDGDEAGQAAALKNLKVLSDEGVDLHIITIPAAGMDPDDYVKKYGRDGFDKLIKTAMPYVEYVLSRIAMRYEINTSTGRAKYVKDALEFLDTITNDAQRDVYLQIIHAKSRVSMDVLREGLGADINAAVANTMPKVVTYKMSDADTDAARFALNLMVSGNKFAKPGDIVSGEVFGDNRVHRLCYDYISDVVKKGQIPRSHMLYSLSQDEEIANILNTVKEFSDETKQVKYYRDCVSRLNINYLNTRVAELSQKYDKADDADKRAVLAEIVECQVKIRSLK